MASEGQRFCITAAAWISKQGKLTQATRPWRLVVRFVLPRSLMRGNDGGWLSGSGGQTAGDTARAVELGRGDGGAAHLRTKPPICR